MIAEFNLFSTILGPAIDHFQGRYLGMSAGNGQVINLQYSVKTDCIPFG